MYFFVFGTVKHNAMIKAQVLKAKCKKRIWYPKLSNPTRFEDDKLETEAWQTKPSIHFKSHAKRKTQNAKRKTQNAKRKTRLETFPDVNKTEKCRNVLSSSFIDTSFDIIKTMQVWWYSSLSTFTFLFFLSSWKVFFVLQARCHVINHEREPFLPRDWNNGSQILMIVLK